MSMLVQPILMSWNRTSSLILFLSFDFICFIVEKLLSQMYVLPNMLAIDSAKSLRSGKRDSGSNLQNETPLSLHFAWKNGSDWISQSSSCNSEGCSLTAAERGSVNNAIRGCMAWKSWKRHLNCCWSVSMSALYLWKMFSHSGTSLRISSQAGKCANFLRLDENPSLKSSNLRRNAFMCA